MVEDEKNGRANVLKEVKHLHMKFDFLTGMLIGSIAYGRKK